MEFLNSALSEPYPTLFDSPLLTSLSHLFLHPLTPLSFVLVYLLIVTRINSHRPSPSSHKKIPLVIIIIHNLGLALFSILVFIKTAPVVFGAFKQGWEEGDRGSYSLRRKWCDLDQKIWNTGLGVWGFVFYLSKFYEVVDTAIILLKGKKVNLLQEYHHAGAILTMWSLVRWASTPLWIFCVFNSAIHGWMYTYYTLTCLNIKLPIVFKKSLTTLQITQFLVGASLAVSYLIIRVKTPTGLNLNDKVGNCLPTKGRRLAVWFNLFYLTPLTFLFAQFFVQSYTRGNLKKRGSVLKIE